MNIDNVAARFLPKRIVDPHYGRVLPFTCLIRSMFLNSSGLSYVCSDTTDPEEMS